MTSLRIALCMASVAGLALSVAATPAHATETPKDKALSQASQNGKGGMGREGKQKMHGKRAEFIIKKMDANGDGKVSKSEHDTFQDQRFKETDVSNDGAITVDELEAYEMKKREERRQMMQQAHGSMEAPEGNTPPPPPPHGDGKVPPAPPANGAKPPFEQSK